MTTDDVERLERELGIDLPSPYKKVVLSYPIPAYSGNADTKVWDNVKRLLEFNQELRRGLAGGVKPWPPNMFATGHAGDGCPTALDLNDGGAVWWVDHSHLDNPSSYKEAPTFDGWAEKYFEGLRGDLEGDGIDPDGTPDDRTLAERSDGKWFYGCITVLLIVLGLMVTMRIMGR